MAIKESMVLFAWSDEELSIGNTLMDHEHRRIITLINQILIAMEQNQGKNVQRKLLLDLIMYTEDHFKREEEIMQRIEYPDLSAHKQAHEKLNKEVLELMKRFVDGRSMLSVEVSRFLSDWVFLHILKDDKKLAAAIANADFDKS